MEDTKRTYPTPEAIHRYQQEMLALYRQQTPPPPNPEPDPQPTNWLEEQYPLPDIERDRMSQVIAEPPASPASPAPDPPAEPVTPLPAPPIAESPFVGYLRVFVTTGNGAEPLPGVQVTVSRPIEEEEVLFASATTNGDGFTSVFPLPSVDPALTLRPDAGQPFVFYDIGIKADGFTPVLYKNVPVYGNNYVTLPVTLVPLLPGVTEGTTQIILSSGPADL